MKSKIVLALCFTLLAVPAFAQRSGGCAQVSVGSDQKNNGQYDTTFSATSVLDIDLSVVFAPGTVNRLGEDHVVELRVFTPSGALYQSIAVPFTSDASKNGKPTKVEGYPHPVKLQTLKSTTLRGQPHYKVAARLPVAGTPIINNSLYGVWNAQAFVDGDTLPCASAATFRIDQ